MAEIVCSTQRKERTTLEIATVLTRLLGNWRPRMPLIRKAASVKIGMSQSCIGSASIVHRIHIVDVQRGTALEHRQNNCQPYRRLGRRHHHHEEREEMAADLLVLVGECHKAQVDRKS